MVSISQERTRLAAVGWRLRTREQWGAKFDYTTARSVDEVASRVFVHITITNPSSYSSNDQHARQVEAIGIARFPNTGISYNRLIMPDGTVYEAQPMGRRGAHTVNDKQLSACTTTGCPSKGTSLTAPSWNLNVNSRAYAICQNVDDPVSDKQVDQVARAIAADMLAGLVSKSASIHGHRCVAWKDCPGSKMWSRLADIRKKVTYYVANGLGGTTTPTPEKDWFDMFASKAELADFLVTVLTGTAKTGTDYREAQTALAANGVDRAYKGVNVPAAARAAAAAGVWGAWFGSGDNRKSAATVLAEIGQKVGVPVDVDEAAIAADVAATLLPLVASTVAQVVADLPGATAEDTAAAVVDALAQRLGA